MTIILSLVISAFAFMVVKANIQYSKAKKSGEIDEKKEKEEMQIW